MHIKALAESLLTHEEASNKSSCISILNTLYLSRDASLFHPSGGSTAGFFASSSNDVYQRVWNTMSGVSMADVMVASNTDGVEKVEDSDGKYAFFMESSSIEYLVERRCKLSQVKTKQRNKHSLYL